MKVAFVIIPRPNKMLIMVIVWENLHVSSYTPPGSCKLSGGSQKWKYTCKPSKVRGRHYIRYQLVKQIWVSLSSQHNGLINSCDL